MPRVHDIRAGRQWATRAAPSTRHEVVSGVAGSGQVTGAPTTGTNNPCGLNRGLGRIEAHGLTIDMLAGMIGSPNGFTVIDKTGLAGPYDWELVYTPDNLRNHPLDRFQHVDPNGPSIFTAVEEQLGLKLELQP
jgi:uncharacterized protein (TIGR03435 family)